jgi:hypothetical protein
MANFSESLTIRILGDSSQLQQELQSVGQRITDLKSQFSQFAEVNRVVDESLRRVTAFARPLENISRLIDRIAGQARALGRVPITLNISPALNALAVLSRAIARIAAQIRSLPPISPGFSGPLPLPGPTRVPLRRFAEGGVVSGPVGLDRVPAMLTAGEFVVREPAARQLGVSFLEALNRNLRPQPVGQASSLPSAVSAEQTTVNNFGGISIRVANSSDVNAIVRDLRFQGFRLRNRRG